MKTPIYLDNQSTTPLDNRVFEVMRKYLLEDFGNPGSMTHIYGERPSEAVEDSRKIIAQLIGAERPSEIVFTSGATESNNLAIQGVGKRLKRLGKTHIITSMIEHKAVLDVTAELEKQSFEVTYLQPDSEGMLDINKVKTSIKENTGLISIMHANNEIGVINPIAEIGEIAADKGIYFHCDAAQSFGKIPINVREMNVHLLSISGHKIYGPKGIGALYVRKQNPTVEIHPLVFGGGHEEGLRSGTLPSFLIAGLAKAAEIANEEMTDEMLRQIKLREQLLNSLGKNCDNVVVNGSLKSRLPNNLNVSFIGTESETLMTNLYNEIAVSNGSACTSIHLEGSYVLKAMGLDSSRVNSALRFGLGRFTASEEIDFAVKRISETISLLKGAFLK